MTEINNSENQRVSFAFLPSKNEINRNSIKFKKKKLLNKFPIISQQSLRQTQIPHQFLKKKRKKRSKTASFQAYLIAALTNL